MHGTNTEQVPIVLPFSCLCMVCMQAMCCDYGFRSGVGRLYQGSTGEVPKNFFALVRTPVLRVALSKLLAGAL